MSRSDPKHSPPVTTSACRRRPQCLDQQAITLRATLHSLKHHLRVPGGAWNESWEGAPQGNLEPRLYTSYKLPMWLITMVSSAIYRW